VVGAVEVDVDVADADVVNVVNLTQTELDDVESQSTNLARMEVDAIESQSSNSTWIPIDTAESRQLTWHG
jgi:hypothetical protein